jgi:hypothetical protein
MASYFNLTLDTTAPAGVSIDVGTVAGQQDITATIATSDTPTTNYQMKIWGDVDTSNDANVQATEGASSWITFATSKAIKLSSGDGSKTINVKVRDDVWNESSAQSDSVTLDTTAPTATISGPDVGKVSKVSGKRESAFSFSPDVAVQAYKVKVVPATNSIHSAGTQIPTTNGSVNMSGGSVSSGATVNCTIDGRDLETAAGIDGTHIVKVFVQETGSGIWSVA